jgi:hypothetical protein
MEHNRKDSTHLIKFLQELVAQLQQEPVPLQLEYNGKSYRREGVPVPETCHDGVCPELDITFNDERLGILHSMKSGWKMDEVKDKDLSMLSPRKFCPGANNVYWY